jgi:hypothetical protein
MHAVPEVSVIVIGSVTHLLEEGRVGYSKALVTENIRFTKCFKGNVHEVPFLPPPLGGTNDPELIRSMHAGHPLLDGETTKMGPEQLHERIQGPDLRHKQRSRVDGPKHLAPQAS